MEDKTVEQLQLEQIEALKAQMEGMVPSDELTKLKEQYQTLLNDYVNKRPVQQAKNDLKPAKEYADKLINSTPDKNPLSNREYIKTSIEYRKAMLAERGVDVFADDGKSTPDTIAVAEGFEQLLNEFEDEKDFAYELGKVLVDDKALVNALRQKRSSKN